MSWRKEGYDEEKIRASEKYKCFPNAVKAAVDIYIESNKTVLPRVWRVVLPEMKDSHAYLQVGENIYNKGVTWVDGKYPDLSLEAIKLRDGLDVTTAVLTQTYLELGNGYKEEKMGFGEAVESLGLGNRESLRKIVEEMMGKSVK